MSQPQTEVTETKITSPGWFTRFSNWVKGKGQPAAIAKAEVEAPAPVEEARKFPYIVRINTGAGVIKARVNAATQKEAIEMAKIDYVRRLSVTAELYDRP